MANIITASTLIDNGLQISENLLIEHVTSGAYHPILGEIIPRFSSKLIPSNYNNIFTANGIPIWQVARNLQLLSNGIIENLFSSVGSDLILKTGFLGTSLNNISIGETFHTLGLSIDIQIKNYEDNPTLIAKDIQKICTRASSIQMTFNNSAWFHIESTPSNLQIPISQLVTPVFQTIDMIEGITESGITSIRGLF